MAKKNRAILYVRVSTDSQSTDMQESELRDYAEARGWVVQKVYSDNGISGVKSSRPGLNEMWADCRKRRFHIVMVWALDRLSRSLRDLIEALDEFGRLGIEFVCLRQNLDTSTSGGRLRPNAEALALKWRDVDFDRGMVTVMSSKTPAGLRTVPMTGRLKEELLRWKKLTGPQNSQFVFF